jgi:excisionase family DNA binding protein
MTPTPANIGRRYASLSDTAEYIGVNEKTVRRRIADGTLTGYRLGGRLLRIDLNEVDQALRPIPTVKAG